MCTRCVPVRGATPAPKRFSMVLPMVTLGPLSVDRRAFTTGLLAVQLVPRTSLMFFHAWVPHVAKVLDTEGHLSTVYFVGAPHLSVATDAQGRWAGTCRGRGRGRWAR
jgi:hypothetical protein